jgi:hypothetical protein
MALIPLDVLLDRAVDSCPACSGSSSPVRSAHEGGAAAVMVSCSCDPFEPKSEPESGARRRKMRDKPRPQGAYLQ